MITPLIGGDLGGFHHRVALRLMGRQPCRGRGGGLVYPPLAKAMAEWVLQEVDTYISCRQNTVAQFILTRPIMDLFMAAQRRPGSRVAKRWWEQGGMRMADQEAERTEGGEDMDRMLTETDWIGGRIL